MYKKSNTYYDEDKENVKKCNNSNQTMTNSNNEQIISSDTWDK